MYKLREFKSMYEPAFNSVLVEIDDKDAQWGSGNDESMLGKSFSRGTLIKCGAVIDTDTYPDSDSAVDELLLMPGKQIIWNEGAEAGTTFEHDGKLYGFIYWYDIRAVAVDEVKK